MEIEILSKESGICDKILSMESDFAGWLNNELDKRGWTQNQLTKKAGLASGTISNILTNSRKMGVDTAVAIARAFNISPQTVLEAAGVLPPEPGIDPGFEEWLYMLAQLPERDQEELLQIARMKLERQEREEKKKSGGRKKE